MLATLCSVPLIVVPLLDIVALDHVTDRKAVNTDSVAVGVAAYDISGSGGASADRVVGTEIANCDAVYLLPRDGRSPGDVRTDVVALHNVVFTTDTDPLEIVARNDIPRFRGSAADLAVAGGP